MIVNVKRKGITVEENIIDRAIRYIAPVMANKRLHARVVGAIAGGYTGADRSRRSMSEWQTRGNDPDTDILFDLPLLRERSRDLIRNNPLATGAINTVCTSVVGTGLKLQARIDRDAISMTEEAADIWERNTEREWRLFSQTQDCDTGRTLNLDHMQDLVFRSTLENGDVFILMPYIKKKNNPYGLSLQIIEADRVVNLDNKMDTDTMAGGVEKDKYGAPVKYHILDQHPGKLIGNVSRTWTSIPAFGSRTGRRNVLHLFRMLRPGQTRGVPYLAPVIEALKQLGKYTESELMATVVSSMFTVFIKSDTGEPDFASMEPSSEVGGMTSDADMKLSSGAIIGLAPGESIDTANPGRPNTAFDPFVMAVMRQVGVALELPFEVLIKHFTASYSAARASLLEAWKFFKSRRSWLSTNFNQMVYESFMDEAVAIGRISAPGYFTDPILRMAYLGSEWVGPAKGMINEKDEVTAAQMRVDLGISTLDREAAELTGADWEQIHQQRVKELKMRKDAGMEQSGNNQGNQTDIYNPDNQP